MLGLALSGGGFRAAFLHVGVLAQMARRGLLRQVDVISTVSGGSTIGALYYLRLQQLLETNPNSTDADYVRLIQDLEAEMLRVAGRNLRMRVYLNPLASLRLPASRLGELFDKYFYHGVRVRDLKLSRPALVLNTTNLQTGKAWRIEAGSDSDIPLGLAVAATAAFPAVYPPVDLLGARVADGGIHDDRGLETLVERGCDRIILTDASFQLEDEEEPSRSVLGMTLRSAKIILNQVRVEQLHRYQPAALVALGNDCAGVAPEVQHRLGRFRIDFDSLTEVEAWSLEMYGYLMADQELAADPVTVPNAKFRFEAMAHRIQHPTPDYLRQLDVASHIFFKPLRLLRPLGVLAALAAIGAAVLLGFLWIPLGVLLVPAAAALLQIKPWGPRWLRLPVEAVGRFLVRGLLPALMSPLVALHLLTLDRLFLRLGRMRKQTGGPAAATGPDKATAGA